MHLIAAHLPQIKAGRAAEALESSRRAASRRVASSAVSAGTISSPPGYMRGDDDSLSPPDLAEETGKVATGFGCGDGLHGSKVVQITTGAKRAPEPSLAFTRA